MAGFSQRTCLGQIINLLCLFSLSSPTDLTKTTEAVISTNFSMNEKGDELDEENEGLPLVSKVIYSIVIPVMVIVCIVGNILTIGAFIQDRQLRTIHNTYLICLATTDLLIGTVSMPFYAVYTLKGYRWPFGTAFCKIYLSIDFVACFESVLIIIIVSYDRLMLLKQGATYSAKQTLRAAKIRILVSWSFSFVIYVPAIIIWDIVRGYSAVKPGDCDVEFYNSFGFIMMTSSLEFVLPLFSIGALNIYIYILIRKHSRNKIGHNSHGRSTLSPKKTAWQQNLTTTAARQTQSTDDNDSSAQNQTIKRERKAARSLAILVSVFTMCWMPYTVCTAVIAFCKDCVSEDLYEAFNWLLWANSSVNPFLYAFTNKKFRKNFIRMVRLQKLCYSRIEPNGERTIHTST